MIRYIILIGISLALTLAIAANKSDNETKLRSPKAFADITDTKERSLALFGEAGKVIQHPRCVNCHPSGDRPLQGAEMKPHQPPVVRGLDGRGAPGMRCTTCHGDKNFNPAGVPGDPHWHLAPREMAWEGKSLGDICRQIKDPERNGGKSMPEIIEHMANDALVGWAWKPGKGREAVPGTHESFGLLIAAWVETGAACPD